MDNEKKTDAEDAPKAKKFCSCGDLRTFAIALLTSLIVLAGYHIARVTFHQYLRCVRGQQIAVKGEAGGCCCCCRRAGKFRMPPRCMPGRPGRPGFGKPFRPGRPGMDRPGKPGFPGKRGRFGKGKPMPPKCDAPKGKCDAPKCAAPEVKPAAPKAPAPAPAPEAKPAPAPAPAAK